MFNLPSSPTINLCYLRNLWFLLPPTINLCNLCNLWFLFPIFNLCNLCNLWLFFPRKNLYLCTNKFTVMPSRILVSYIVDLILLFFSFVLMAIYKEGTPNYLSYRYLTGFGVLIASWSIFSFYFRKYRFKRKYKLGRILKNIFLSNIATLSTLAIFMIALSVSGYSRLMFFGTVGICTFFEIILANLYFLLIHTRGIRTDLYNPPPKAYEIRKAKEGINYRDISLSSDIVREAVVNECGEEAL